MLQGIEPLHPLSHEVVSKAGDTMTGQLLINHDTSNVKGLRSNVLKWFVGLNASNSDDILLHAFSHNNTLTLKSDKTESKKPLYVGANKVLTTLDLANNLTTNDTTKALTAAQGKALNEAKADKATTLAGYGITDAVNTGSLTGAVMYFAMTSPPDGWLKADGRAVSRTTYATLFARIGTTFGAGDGRTTFNLPDLRGEFIRGWDNGRNVDSGRAFGSAQKSSMQALASTGKSLVTGITNKDNTPTDIWRRAQHDKINQNESGYQDVKASYTSTFSWHGRNELGVVNNGNNEIEFGGVRPRNVALLACIKY